MNGIFLELYYTWINLEIVGLATKLGHTIKIEALETQAYDKIKQLDLSGDLKEMKLFGIKLMDY